MDMWDLQELARTARRALEEFSRQSVEEQAVHGVDALSELQLHPLLAAAFRGAGFGVTREHPYPGEAAKRPLFRSRPRCDLVLTSSPDLALIDPVAELLETDKGAGTLFAEVAPALSGITPSEAFWLEVKVVGQFTYTLGVPGPNRAYGSELTTSLYVDLAKIGADESLRHAGLLLILFTDEQATAEHDLSIALHRSLDRGFRFRSPVVETFHLPDRVGNRTCTVALVPGA
jgi:hypothetical protein